MRRQQRVSGAASASVRGLRRTDSRRKPVFSVGNRRKTLIIGAGTGNPAHGEWPDGMSGEASDHVVIVHPSQTL